VTELIPAIIPKSYRDVEESIAKVKDFVSTVQIDVMDGVFAPEPSWPYNGTDPQKFRDLIEQKNGFPFWELLDVEMDMMVADPHEKIDDWIATGASTLIIHSESTDRMEDIVTTIRERGAQYALALKPSTNNEELERWVEHAEFIQCMGNDKIGFHGVAFDPSVLDKIRDLKKRFPNTPIGVDIGVNKDTAQSIVEAGATRLVSGSAIFNADSLDMAIHYFQNL